MNMRIPDPPPEFDGDEMDTFIRLKDGARRLGVSTMWLYNRRGRLPFLVRMHSGPVRVSLKKLKAYMEAAAMEPAKAPREWRKR